MKIAIDLSQISKSKTGIEYYAFELSKEIIKKDLQNQYILVTNNIEYLQGLKLPSNTSVLERKADRPNFKWIRETDNFLKKHKIDYLLSVSFFMHSLFFPRTIQVIHDLSPINFPQSYPLKAKLMFRVQLLIASYRAKMFLVISRTTLKDFTSRYRHTRKKTFYIGAGLHEWTNLKVPKKQEKEIIEKYSLPKNYFLSVSTIQPRKNYKRMILAFYKFQRMNPDYQYIIVGQKGWLYAEIFEMVKQLKLEKNVKFLGYVPESDLPTIYDNAKALLFCSLQEGFGIPAIEAYSRGVTVVTSDIEVTREVMEEKAIYANPRNIDSILEAMEIAVQHSFAIEKDFIADYKWSQVAQRVIDSYKNLS